jgi:hypothetical protein
MPPRPSFYALSALLPLVLLAGPRTARAQETPERPPAPVQAPGLAQEPEIFSKAAEYAGDKLTPSPGMPKHDGLYPEFGYMVTGSGWISAGPGYHHKFLDNRALFDTSAAISWRTYKIAQARVEFHAVGEDTLIIGAQGFYQDATQIHFFGLGRDSLKSDKGAYRLHDFDTVGWVRYNLKPVVISGTIGWMDSPTISSPSGPFKSGYEDARTLFGDAGAPGLLTPVSFLHANADAAVDTRDQALHGTHGGMYRVGMSTYSDRDRGQFSFQTYEAEGVQYVPLIPSRNWVLALHGWLVGTDTSQGNSLPVYLMPALGGHDTLRGYVDYRFHDRSLLLASAESRWAIWEHLDLALFLDAGNVAPRVGDLNLSKTSVGVGVRVHSHTATLGRLDLAHSKEGWRVLFKMDDPFALSRLSRRTATVPFVP